MTWLLSRIGTTQPFDYLTTQPFDYSTTQPFDYLTTQQLNQQQLKGSEGNERL